MGPVLSLGQVLLQVGSLALSSAQPLLSLLACLLHPAARHLFDQLQRMQGMQMSASHA